MSPSRTPPSLLVTMPPGRTAPAAWLLMAHGAGAAMDSAFLEAMAAALCERGLGVMRFEFAYMAARRKGGSRRPPPKAETLVGELVDAVATAGTQRPRAPIFVGGKSMGGRVASMAARDLWQRGMIAGCVCLGYPFHPPKKPDALRTAHLLDTRCPTLIVQGERDPLGTRAEVEGLRLAPAIEFAWLADGDHDFAPRRASGQTTETNRAMAADAVNRFVRNRLT
jgi:uncharacterized protein